MKEKNKKHHRMYSRFEDKEYEWLDVDIFSESDRGEEPPILPESSMSEVRQEVVEKIPGGRPTKSWYESSSRTKRRKASTLAADNSTAALTAAAVHRAKDSPGQADLRFVLKKASADTSGSKRSLEIVKQEPIMMSKEDALALKICSNLSDDQYQMIRNSSLVHNANIYPTLQRILEAKKLCYPSGIEVTETSAQCSLQALVGHTLDRILILSKDKLEELSQVDNTGIFYIKAEFDGASSQSIYNQQYKETD